MKFKALIEVEVSASNMAAAAMQFAAMEVSRDDSYPRVPRQSRVVQIWEAEDQVSGE